MIRDPGNIRYASVRIIPTVGEHDLIVGLQFFECFFVTEVIAFSVGNRDLDLVTLFIAVREHRFIGFDFQWYGLADELQMIVPSHGTRQETGFEQYLESIAYTKDGLPTPSVDRNVRESAPMICLISSTELFAAINAPPNQEGQNDLNV